MSAEAVGWVYRHSPYEGQFLAVHLAVADTVSDQHANQFWMVLPKLAAKARVNRGTAKRALDHMCDTDEWGDSPFLELVEQSDGGRGRPSVYRFLFPDVPVVYETRASGTTGPAETRASHTKPARHARKPAHDARGKEPKEPNDQNAGEKRSTIQAGCCGEQVPLVDILEHELLCPTFAAQNAQVPA